MNPALAAITVAAMFVALVWFFNVAPILSVAVLAAFIWYAWDAEHSDGGAPGDDDSDRPAK